MISFIMFSILLFVPSCLLAMDTEATGFRDIKWGAHISSISNIVNIKNSFENGCSYVANIRDDNLAIGKSGVMSIKYCFNSNKQFSKVIIKAEDINTIYKQIQPLYETIVAKYGHPDVKNDRNLEREAYSTWNGKLSGIKFDIIYRKAKKTRQLIPDYANLEIFSKEYIDAIDTSGL